MTLASFRILVADDDPALVNLLKEALEMEGHAVLTAYDGLMAIEQVAKLHPDILIMDVNMPGLSGPEALARLRQDPASQHLPVLFLTGESGGTRLTGSDPRCSSMEKPVDLDALIARITRLVTPL